MPIPPDPVSSAPGDSPSPGRRLREIDLILPLAAAICIFLGWYVILDYERVVVPLAVGSPAVASRLVLLRLVMGLLSIGGLGLSVLAARDARRRRQAEASLLLAHAALARRMARRTDILRVRTRALREARLRERLAESEAETAFAAGRVEAAGAYLHEVGNCLSALDLELLRLTRALAAGPRLEAVFRTLESDIRSGDADTAARTAGLLEQTLLGRAMPRLSAGVAAIAEVKDRMAGDLERHRGEFERQGKVQPYLQEVRLDLEVAAILDRMPRVAGSDPVARELAGGVRIRTRKQPFLAGLAALLRQALDTAPDAVTVRLTQGGDGAVVLALDGAGMPDVEPGAVADGINFINENSGSLRYDPGAPGRPPCLIIELDARLPKPAAPAPGLS
ncbi:hypothetical protein DVDV_1927 [Desulfovibrio sp. DV]|uniref:hypothetical protein n=1 Tax=Desulfovibrio sp. DV TaxID=1844708 RepID=UPI00094B9AB9|nr:hypothetical protein [Desulfovibrio sp. DV]OLN27860.1 hypothetical protein DVDV_1927 [Desulfovibrio sp. DV]